MAKLLTVPEVAARLNTSVETVRRWCRLNLLKRRKLGRDWYVSEAELTRFVPPKKGPPFRRKRA